MSVYFTLENAGVQTFPCTCQTFGFENRMSLRLSLMNGEVRLSIVHEGEFGDDQFIKNPMSFFVSFCGHFGSGVSLLRN